MFGAEGGHQFHSGSSGQNIQGTVPVAADTSGVCNQANAAAAQGPEPVLLQHVNSVQHLALGQDLNLNRPRKENEDPHQEDGGKPRRNSFPPGRGILGSFVASFVAYWHNRL